LKKAAKKPHVVLKKKKNCFSSKALRYFHSILLHRSHPGRKKYMENKPRLKHIQITQVIFCCLYPENSGLEQEVKSKRIKRAHKKKGAEASEKEYSAGKRDKRNERGKPSRERRAQPNTAQMKTWD
jgi:hypothetical protein